MEKIVMSMATTTRRDRRARSASGIGRLPDFLIIGAAKSGTTTLDAALRRCPQVHMPSVPQEPSYFSDDLVYRRGPYWYKALFRHAKPGQVCGEKSTNYTRHPQLPHAPQRIAEAVPDVRLIYIVRHPVDRAYSHYVHRATREVDRHRKRPAPFEQFVQREPMCLDSSFYMKQIDQYRQHFADDQLLVLLFRDLVQEPEQSLRRVARFIGVDVNALAAQPVEHCNAGRSHQQHRLRRWTTRPLRTIPGVSALAKRVPRRWRDAVYEKVLAPLPYGQRVREAVLPKPMKAATRRRLLERFRPENDRLAEYLQRDLSHWNE